MRTVFSLAVLAALTGCVTMDSPEVIEARIAARHTTACEGYGFVQGTTEFAECMQREAHADQARNDARKARDAQDAGIIADYGKQNSR